MLSLPALVCSFLPGAAPPASVVARPRAAAAQLCAAALAEPKMESAVGFDFIPLKTALQTQDFLEADQLTRDGLITIAGKASQQRGFVYFSEVPKLPVEDMSTIERLWNTYSDGKFGYTVQQEIFQSKKVANVLERMYERIGWSHPGGSLLRWLPDKGNEFIYDLEKAPKGHLPLTSTLRGTQLLLGLMQHPAWEAEEFKK